MRPPHLQLRRLQNDVSQCLGAIATAHVVEQVQRLHVGWAAGMTRVKWIPCATTKARAAIPNHSRSEQQKIGDSAHGLSADAVAAKVQVLQVLLASQHVAARRHTLRAQRIVAQVDALQALLLWHTHTHAPLHGRVGENSSTGSKESRGCQP